MFAENSIFFARANRGDLRAQLRVLLLTRSRPAEELVIAIPFQQRWEIYILPYNTEINTKQYECKYVFENKYHINKTVI